MLEFEHASKVLPLYAQFQQFHPFASYYISQQPVEEIMLEATSNSITQYELNLTISKSSLALRKILLEFESSL